MLKRILAPLDGSPCAESVLPHVFATARALEAEVLLLRVVGTASGEDRLVPDAVDWSFRRAGATGYLSRIAEEFARRGLPVEKILLEGEPSQEIVETAWKRSVDLVALSTHGAGGRRPFHYGSTTAKVVSRVGKSLLIIPSRETDAGWAETVTYRRILVPLDCSQRSMAALMLATQLGRSGDAELVLAHVVPIPEMPHPATPLDAEDLLLRDQVVARNRRLAQRYFDSFLDVTRSPSFSSRTRMEHSAHVARTLHRLVAEESPDLVVMNAHGCGSGEEDLPTWPYGSVCGHLLTYGQVPRLVWQDDARRHEEGHRTEAVGRRPLGQPQPR